MTQLTDQNFNEEVLKEKGLVVVDFWAPWCGPCKMMGPVIEELAIEYKGKAKIVELNVDENQTTPASFDIMSIPTIIFFKNGEVLEQVIGFNSKEVMKEKIDKYC